MHLSIYHRALLLATAMAFAGASACSRSDRAEAGRDTTTSETATETPKATPNPRAEVQDSSVTNQDQGVSGYRAMEHDPATVALGDSGAVDKPGERLEPTAASQQANADTMASDSGRIRPPEDSSETTDSMPADHAMADHAMSDTAAAQEVSTDTTDADYAPMARDTSVTLALVDTTTATEAEADTISTATEPIRPPEDSTEIYADADLATVGDANVDAVGAAQIQPTGNTVTGAEAVALMSRQGQRCVIVDSEESRDAQWDMASSPATLNPCGTGTMTLQRIWTAEKE